MSREQKIIDNIVGIKRYQTYLSCKDSEREKWAIGFILITN